ncbi:PREDICTED: uncharacterized protein LOC104800623 isoform X3 [Tarenaya hassleriana]|uniref:uncharacterized protein LOC104800623 isoform X3 n=1 Tax=Tarenaya hassleriana TaxID=28532 RepID=UPI00053C5CE8|nr:PREDICTED: uncharacterized protein LOC104800623 isoform X3 [Tarenaya hassleriana]
MDALSLTEFKLMELLIVGLVEWVALITESNSPQGQCVMIEIGLKTFPKVFHLKEMAQEVAARADDGKNSCFATDFTEKP